MHNMILAIFYGGPQQPNSGCAMCDGVNAFCPLPNLSLALAFTLCMMNVKGE